jgi:hypothetical protein
MKLTQRRVSTKRHIVNTKGGKMIDFIFEKLVKGVSQEVGVSTVHRVVGKW